MNTFGTCLIFKIILTQLLVIVWILSQLTIAPIMADQFFFPQFFLCNKDL